MIIRDTFVMDKEYRWHRGETWPIAPIVCQGVEAVTI